ncbi:Rne/Rng family ribonuclease [Roseomonas sp. E05]|uniref:Rne/Rng family ribonuclease n=1 Tax=Roseomonas sp. E05 TaxID=3046310 RepID=UPI0024B9C885|nr:Rne/Rng family ribonuclease [Roseomonas sp. E05]MDJ0386603.1 Rne/Rng family ribonuclease [Roseomonas sp. E05]
MTKRMLIDASHAEETRVVVLDGNRIDEFDIETENKRPLKGNIYLAKVVRVEPSLQAAFVEYGGNRHGFLAFSEIHPDYYQIPVADRERLLAMQAQEAAEDEDDEDEVSDAEAEAVAAAIEQVADADERAQAAPPSSFSESHEPEHPREVEPGQVTPRSQPMAMRGERRSARPEDLMAAEAAAAEATVPHEGMPVEEEGPAPETLGGRDKDEAEDVRGERRIPPRFLRHYKIQEVIRRRQIMLVQVVKEERGNKGAALTTYISLAGRFSVLMPNSPRAGGISRKITSIADRKRLREVIQELGMPRGMSLIVRTAGAGRPKPEILRDCEYLLRLWDDIRERTLESVAPALIYQEADLIKRSIRDVFGRDIEDIQIEGEDAYRQVRDFMRMLMPQNERKIRLYRDGSVPLFARHGVEAQLDAMMSPTVQLRSGGYIVINQTEALVAIDVNSGRNTRDRHIEDTALRTNMEAAEEIARQLRLRDLAGLIVIDFIDMESSRNDAQVERRLKEALKSDRARIQVGRISHFGLLEMSRQRLRPSVTEHSFITCPHCQGLGIVRSAESAALQVLRQIEEEGARRRAAEICVRIAPDIAIHLLNRRRDRLSEIEARYNMAVVFEPDAQLSGPAIQIERTRAPIVAEPAAAPAALRMDYAPEAEVEAEAEPVVAVPEAPAAAAPAEVSGEAPSGPAEEDRGNGNGERRRRRRRRRRGGRREEMNGAPGAEAAEADATEAEDEGEEDEAEGTAPAAAEPEAAPEATPESEEDRRLPRRRGRRGGRRRPGEGTAEPRPVYAGPTPADPFAGTLDDIFDAMAAAEEAAQQGPVPRQPPALPAVDAEVAPVASATPESAPVTEPGPVVEPEPVAEAEPEAPAEAPQPEAAPQDKVAQAAGLAPEQTAAEAPATGPATGEMPAAETPAKPRRTRASRAKAAATEASTTEAPAAEAPPTEEVAPAKPRRTRRTKAAEAAATEAVPAAETPAKPRRTRRTKAAEAPATEAPATEPAAPEAPAAAAPDEEPQAAPPVQPVLVDLAPEAPRKRGWWKR